MILSLKKETGLSGRSIRCQHILDLCSCSCSIFAIKVHVYVDGVFVCTRVEKLRSSRIIMSDTFKHGVQLQIMIYDKLLNLGANLIGSLEWGLDMIMCQL